MIFKINTQLGMIKLKKTKKFQVMFYSQGNLLRMCHYFLLNCLKITGLEKT